MHVLINQLGSLMKEEEDMRSYHNHINMYRTEMKHKTTTNHNTNVIMEFDNLAYISGPCLSGLCLFLFEALQVHHDSDKRLQQ
jgi:hypothetical protein